MTEAEWLECPEPGPMLRFLRDRASERKAQLFACACCRRIWHHLSEEASRRIVETAERHADGLINSKERVAAVQAADRVHATLVRSGYLTTHPRFCAAAAANAALWGGFNSRVECARLAASAIRGSNAPSEPNVLEQQNQAHLVRCIWGNPFRRTDVDPAWLAWRDGLVRQLARAVYEERRFAELPILADALEDAGCTDADMLAHCRQPVEHVRGCWVVDLLLGKQ